MKRTYHQQFLTLVHNFGYATDLQIRADLVHLCTKLQVTDSFRLICLLFLKKFFLKICRIHRNKQKKKKAAFLLTHLIPERVCTAGVVASVAPTLMLIKVLNQTVQDSVIAEIDAKSRERRDICSSLQFF